MAAYLTEVVRPPKFCEWSNESHVETLRDWIPHRWRNGDRDSIESIGEILGEAKRHELWRKVGSESWADYCSAFLSAKSEAIDELIEGVRILQGQGPVSKDLSKDDARKAAADKAREQKEQADQNKACGISLPDLVRKVPNDGGNSEAYLLRRLERHHPEILAAYERGEFPSAAAAARSVGIRRSDEKPLTLMRRAWKNASAKEREQIIAWINDQAN